MRKTIHLFQKKIQWTKTIGGLTTFIVHTPAWGMQDAKNRLLLLEEVITATQDSWNVKISELAAWWEARQNISFKIDNGTFYLVNNNAQDIEGISLRVQSLKGTKKFTLPALKKGKKISLKAFAPSTVPGKNKELKTPSR